MAEKIRAMRLKNKCHWQNGIILGGTFDHDDWSLEPKPEQTTQILEAHAEIMKGLK
jgi:hypothetical protein